MKAFFFSSMNIFSVFIFVLAFNLDDRTSLFVIWFMNYVIDLLYCPFFCAVLVISHFFTICVYDIFNLVYTFALLLMWTFGLYNVMSVQ